MTDDAERNYLIRHSRKTQRLGEPAPVCLACGEARIEALLDVSWRDLPEWLQRKIIEQHHPAGRAVDPAWEVPLCKNCHPVANALQYDLPIAVRHPRTEREQHAAMLYGVDDWLRILGLPDAHFVRTRVRAAAEFLRGEETRQS